MLFQDDKDRQSALFDTGEAQPRLAVLAAAGQTPLHVTVARALD